MLHLIEWVLNSIRYWLMTTTCLCHCSTALFFWPGSYHCRKNSLWLGWGLHFSFGTIKSIYQYYGTGWYGWRLKVDTSLTSQCSKSSKNIVFNNKHLPSVFQEKPIALAYGFFFLFLFGGGFTMGSLWSKIGKIYPIYLISVKRDLFDNERCHIGASFPLIFGNFI